MPNVVISRNNYYEPDVLRRVLQYVGRGALIGGYGLDPENAYTQMVMVKRVYHKLEGKQMEHFFIAFSDREIQKFDLSDLMALGFKIAACFEEYQMFFSLHADTSHLHLHFVMNSVSFLTGRKYSDGLYGFQKIKAMLSELFPKSQVGVYFSYPNTINQYSESPEDELLRMDS